MSLLHLPTFNYQLQVVANKPYIFDIIRKKYVRLTPEEWTRQHLVHYLVQELSYPKALISIERQIQGHYRMNRPDLVTYNKKGNPLLVAECKASHIAITEKTYNQLARYNRQLQSPLLVITNGQAYQCWKINDDGSGPEVLPAIPVFDTWR